MANYSTLRSPLILGISSALFIILLSLTGPFKEWEAKTLDYRFQLRGNI